MAKKKTDTPQPEVNPAAGVSSQEKDSPSVEATELTVEEKLAKAEAEKQTLLTVNQELQERLETTEKQKASTLPQVMIDGELYSVTVPKFSFEGKEYTAQELAENTSLAAKLLKISANVFRKSEEA